RCNNGRMMWMRWFVAATRIVVRFSLVNAGIIVALRLIRIAVLIVIHLALVIAAVVAGIVIVRIGNIIRRVRRAVAIIRDTIAVVVIVWVVPRRPPRIESDIKDDPRAVKEMTSVAVPPVIAVAVPITMPVRRTL